MSGHNKWSTIKHKKAAADAKKGKVFSRIARELMIAARSGGGDINANFALRNLIAKARSVNMPADNVDRAIKKGTGEIDGGQLDEMMYEGYAGGGVAVIVQVLTDNKNRSAAEVRHAFTKAGASMAQQGSVSRSFHRKGQIIVNAEKADEESLLELALEAGAEDLINQGEVFEILTDPNDYQAVVEALEKAEIEMENSEVALIPETTVPVTKPSDAAAVLRFIDSLEELDDVQNVYSNYDIADELMEQLSEE